MQVLWIDTISELGGAQHSLLEVCGQLRRDGISVLAAVPPGPLFDKLQALNIEVHPIAPLRATRQGWRAFKTVLSLLQVAEPIGRLLTQLKPDIIHANSLTAFLALQKYATKYPVILHLRDLRLSAMLLRQSAARAVRIIAASSAVDEFLADILPPRNFGVVRVYNNGIMPAKFSRAGRAAARQRFKLPPDAPVVGMIAHLVSWKRHLAFVEIAALIQQAVPGTHFVMAGRDLLHDNVKLAQDFKKAIAEYKLEDSLHWIETCDDSSLLLPAFDVLLHPALGEPFGRAVCEAMATSLPVVASASAGMFHLVQDKKTGILVRGGEVGAMAEATVALLRDPTRAAAMGEAARARVLAEFDVARLAKDLSREYRAIRSEWTSH